MTDCCVVGGGPAGMMLAVLLARAGVSVTVLEKHDDFLRDFRGDTVHASTLTLLDELGLGERFSAIPHSVVQHLTLPLGWSTSLMIDLGLLPGPHKYIAMVPQWDLLDMLADAGRREPSFTLRMGVEVTGLLREHGRVVGVRYRDAGGSEGELRAALTVGCDGRTSVVRAASGLRVREFGVPMDVWWFRLPRGEVDLQGLNVRVGDDALLVVIDRGSYFQLGYQIAKGSDARLRAEGIEAFQRRVVALAPAFADSIDALDSWDEVKLLAVRLDRLPRWFNPGLLCIGDLARVQIRRWAPTFVTQSLQRLVHRGVFEPVLAGRPGRAASGPRRRSRLAALLRRFPRLQVIPAYVVAIGVLPEHAPSFARRSSTS
jgi:2-polyprenyl-6-methoxyphenol hydroxylase-like FAD-dependent oxidoreductase